MLSALTGYVGVEVFTQEFDGPAFFDEGDAAPIPQIPEVAKAAIEVPSGLLVVEETGLRCVGAVTPLLAIRRLGVGESGVVGQVTPVTRPCDR